jgi:hypothetical protein
LLWRGYQADGDGRSAGTPDDGIRAVIGWVTADDIKHCNVDATLGRGADHTGRINLVDESLEISNHSDSTAAARNDGSVIDDRNGRY